LWISKSNCKNDTFTCAVNSIIKLNEVTAHAGEPEKGNPALAIASLLINLMLLFSPIFQKREYCLINQQSILKWEKPTVCLVTEEVHFTVRSDSNSQMKVELSSEKLAINSKGHQLECNILGQKVFANK
jgi:hypothetical protein